MYYSDMAENIVEIRLDRIEAEMRRANLDGKNLARATGISEAAISKLLSGKSPGMSALNVSRIARALRVSVDYLMGLTDDPLPSELTREGILAELLQVSERLTDRRRRDLLMIAQAYLEVSRLLQGDPRMLMAELLDLVNEAGGTNSRKLLIELLQSDRWPDGQLSPMLTQTDDNLGGDALADSLDNPK